MEFVSNYNFDERRMQKILNQKQTNGVGEKSLPENPTQEEINKIKTIYLELKTETVTRRLNKDDLKLVQELLDYANWLKIHDTANNYDSDIKMLNGIMDNLLPHKEDEGAKGPEFKPVTASAADILAEQNKFTALGSNDKGINGTNEVKGGGDGFFQVWDMYQTYLGYKEYYNNHQSSMSTGQKACAWDHMIGLLSAIEHNSSFGSLSPTQQAAVIGDKTMWTGSLNEVIPEGITSAVINFEMNVQELGGNPSAEQIEQLIHDAEEIMSSEGFKEMASQMAEEIANQYAGLIQAQIEINMNGVALNGDIVNFITDYEISKVMYQHNPTLSNANTLLNNLKAILNHQAFNELPDDMKSRLTNEYYQFSNERDNKEIEHNNHIDLYGGSPNMSPHVGSYLESAENDPDDFSMYSFAFQNFGMGRKLSYFRTKVAKNQSTIAAMQKILDFPDQMSPSNAKARAQAQISRFNVLLELSRDYLNQSGPSHKDIMANPEQTQNAR